MEDALVSRCRSEALQLLRANLMPHGLRAATLTEAARARRYTAIFARDVGISVLGMVLQNDPVLVQGARISLETLARHQAANGQIPKYVNPEAADSDFWYVGCIDATLWWLVAVRQMQRLGHELGPLTEGAVDRAIDWMRCQEHPRLFLVQQNEASDWADIMPRSGFVLYSNALWYYVKRLYELPGQDETAYHFNHLFFPFTDHEPEYRRLRLLQDYILDGVHDRDLYLSFVNFSVWGNEGDVFGNLLAVLFGLADRAHSDRILDTLLREAVDDPLPVRVVCEPIARDSPLWRTYMDRHGQNQEYQYHNGGIWPFVGGFWVIALAAHGRREQAALALSGLARANQAGDWRFSEWLHGRTRELSGMAGQSWNAAMFLLADASLTSEQPLYGI